MGRPSRAGPTGSNHVAVGRKPRGFLHGDIQDLAGEFVLIAFENHDLVLRRPAGEGARVIF